MTTLNTLAPAIAMLAVFLLAATGARLIWRGAERRKGVLMLVMAAVLVANIMVWTW